MIASYLEAWRRYADFGGRSTRGEYWWFVLGHFLAMGALWGFESAMGWAGEDGGLGLLSALYQIAIFIPSWAIVVRRLHDIGKSGWYFWVVLIPFLGFVWLFFLLVERSEPGANRWGAYSGGY
ncbi:MAG: hypothetical protein RJA19_1169 [Bacteroidota bacterium]|jgi:uncharacterized membrane protein YhaH (DUF805 family)